MFTIEKSGDFFIIVLNGKIIAWISDICHATTCCKSLNRAHNRSNKSSIKNNQRITQRDV